MLQAFSLIKPLSKHKDHLSKITVLMQGKYYHSSVYSMCDKYILKHLSTLCVTCEHLCLQYVWPVNICVCLQYVWASLSVYCMCYVWTSLSTVCVTCEHLYLQCQHEQVPGRVAAAAAPHWAAALWGTDHQVPSVPVHRWPAEVLWFPHWGRLPHPRI